MRTRGTVKTPGTTRTKREPVPMQGALQRFLRESGLDRRLKHWPVFEAWTAAVGPSLARRAIPVRFGDGELVVEVESAAHLQELKNFTGDHYRALANQRLGRAEIAQVVFRMKR